MHSGKIVTQIEWCICKKMITILKVCLLIISSYTLITVTQSQSVNVSKPFIRDYKVLSTISNTYARTNVTSCVFNPANNSQEYTFQVVIPENAFITGFRMLIDNRIYESQVKEKEKAQKEYDSAVSAGQDAGLVKETIVRDSKYFVVSINIKALKVVCFTLTYEELLERRNGYYKNTINIRLTQIVRRLTVRYIVEDVLNITKIHVLKFKTTDLVDENEEGIENQNVKKVFIAPNKVIIEWKPTQSEQRNINSTGLNGQMIMKYDVDDSKYPQTALVDEDGNMVHRIRYFSFKVLRKHIVFVLDVSGSMFGTKIEQLKIAMFKCLDDMSENDLFSIVLFSVGVLVWDPDGNNNATLDYYGEVSEPVNVPVKKRNIITASKDNTAKAKDFIKNMGTYGGTNIMAGMEHGIKAVKLGQVLLKDCPGKIVPLIFFLTDGLPNVQESDPDKIIDNVKKLNTIKARIFCLSFGFDADYEFLKRMSLSNNGIARKIYEAADAGLQYHNIFLQFIYIVLFNIKVEYAAAVSSATTISETLCIGEEIIIIGKVNPKNIITGYLTAESIDGEITIRIDPHTFKRPYKIGYLEKMWAFKTIKLYLDQYAVTKNETWKEMALERALEYKFVTPVTSLVVVKPENSSLVNDGEEGAPPEFDAGVGGFKNLARIGGPGPAIPLASFGASTPLGSFGSIPISNGFGKPADTDDVEDEESAEDKTSSQQQVLPVRPFPPVQPLPPILPPILNGTEIPPVPTPPPEEEYPEEMYKVPYTCVSWLNHTNGAVCPFIEPPKDVDENDLIALNKGNSSHSKCADGSDCVHFIHCPLNVFADDPKAFLPFKCHIAPIFLGVCCPFFC